MTALDSEGRIVEPLPQASAIALLKEHAATPLAQQAIVIGGGFGGMAAALRLRAKGYQVTLIERQAELGGRAQVFTRGGFRHDAGPTVLTAPGLFEELFELFGKRLSNYVQLQPLDIWYRFHFHDGSTFDYGGTPEQTAEEIRKHEPADVEGYLKLLAHSRKLFDVAYLEMAGSPYGSFWSMLREAPRLLRLSGHLTVWQLISKHLRNDNLRQAFSIHPLLVGGNPFATTSIYCLIHYLERKWGVSAAAGGTGAVVQAIKRLMIEEGVQILTGETVDKITVTKGKVQGVVLANGQRWPASIIVSNCDPLHLYGHMLPEKAIAVSARVKRRSRLSMGLFVLFFGTRKTYPDVQNHTIVLGRDFRRHLDTLFNKLEISEQVSLYLHRPTATDPSFAPEGMDSFYALCPVPHLRSGIDWHQAGPKLQETIIDALQASVLPELRSSITDVFYDTPQDFAERYLSVDGAGFSIAPYFTQSAWFRFHNRGEGIAGLYLVGAGTHPGAGIPGVLCSAKAAAELIEPVGR